MLQEKGKQPAETATLMGRDLSNVYHHFQRNHEGGAAPNPVGRPPALTAAQVGQVGQVVDTTETMVVAVDGEYQVAAKTLRDAVAGDGFEDLLRPNGAGSRLCPMPSLQTDG